MSDRVISYSFRGSFANLNAGLATAGRNVGELGTKLTALDKNGAKMRAGLTTLGGTAGKVGVLAAAGLGVAIYAAANFEKAMSSVQAATHETAANMDLLRKAAIEAGQATKYSASEAAGAIEELAKAGVSTTDILNGGLSGALNLAAAGGLEVADAAEIAATALTQFKLSGSDVPHVADELAAGAGKAQGSVSDLGMALKQSGLVASQFGLSLDDTVGSLSAFASAGLLGSDAGTSFKQLLLSLASPTNKAADLMASLGIAAYDAQGNFVGITDLAGQLQEAFKGQSQAARDSALSIIFGSDAIRAANVLYTQGATGIQGWIDKTNDSGYAAETAAIKMDNLAGDFEQLRGSLETALIGAGGSSQGPLRQLVQGATATVNALNKIPQSGKNAATGLLAVTAVLGGGLWFTSKVVNGVSSARSALEQLGVSSERSGKALKAVGVAAGGLAALEIAATGIRAIQQATDDALPGVNALTASLIKLNNGEASSLGDDFDDLSASIDRITNKSWSQGFFDAIQTPFKGLFGEQGELRVAKEDVDAIDAALANLVAQAGPEEAAAALDSLAASSGLTADQVKDLKTILPQYDEAVAGAANSTALAADATGNYGTKARTAAQQTSLLNDEIRKSREDAKATADAFVGLGDSLNDGKKSLGEWIHSLQQQANALHNFRVNAQTAADKGLRQGLIKALQEAGPEGALRMKQLANATDAEIKKANGAWQSGQREVKKYTDAIGGVPTKVHTDVKIDTFDAMAAVTKLKNSLDQIHSKDVLINLHYTGYSNKLGAMAGEGVGVPRAAGGPIYGPGTKTSDSVPVMASRGEFMMSAAAVDHYGLGTMFAMNARRLAGGGPVDGPRSLDTRLEIAQFLQQIAGMRHDLAAVIKKGDHKGQHELTGLDREVAQLQLETAQRDLKRAKHAEEQAAQEKAVQRFTDLANLYSTRGGLFNGLLPQQPQTVAQGVSATISDFKAQWLKAGGEWTKGLREWAQNARAAAREYDRVTSAIDAETAKRDALTETLDTQKAQYDQLVSTMKSFEDSVAANFMNNPFNGATTKTVAGAAGPATAALAEATAELAAIRASGSGDSIQAAARAAELIAQIKELQAEAAAETADAEVQVSGLDALRASLATDTQNALAFSAALDALKAKGLDTSGDFGGLYASLAQSGDLATAQQLATLSPEAIDELEKAYKARDDAAIAAGYKATQDVYGQQAAVTAAAMQQTQAAIDAATASIELMNAALPVIADNVRNGSESGAQLTIPKLENIHRSTQATTAAVQALAGQQAEQKKKDKV